MPRYASAASFLSTAFAAAHIVDGIDAGFSFLSTAFAAAHRPIG